MSSEILAVSIHPSRLGLTLDQSLGQHSRVAG
jgi:hypothetical protein